jgi:activator of 2-hydroxyglutaryl-CoA dehydratase
MVHVLGIDIGSGFSKAVVCAGSTILSHAIMPSGGNYKETAGKVVHEALTKASLSFQDISYAVATGYPSSFSFSQDSY